MKNLTNTIIEKIEKEEEISPFLFLAKNTQLAQNQIMQLAYEILGHFWVPKTFLYTFEASGKNIKVEEIKRFIEKIHIKSSYKIQIFFIENIQNFTVNASNSLLKILEEPGVWNLVFLSSTGENTVLETILSRVQNVYLDQQQTQKESAFFQDLLASYLSWTSQELISYFFANKLEKDEYIQFLENIILYGKKHFMFIEFLEEILWDISAIEKNNVNPRYIVDKWIVKLKL